MTKGDTATGASGALSVADVLGRVEVARKLLALASERHHQAKTNLDSALTGLEQLAIELSTPGKKVAR